MNIQAKINTLVRALNKSGYICLTSREQHYSKKIGEVCTVFKAFHLLPVDEYNKLYPEKKKNPEKYNYVKIELISSFKQYEILLKLIDIYKKVGVSNG